MQGSLGSPHNAMHSSSNYATTNSIFTPGSHAYVSIAMSLCIHARMIYSTNLWLQHTPNYMSQINPFTLAHTHTHT